ncbi:hypothetical protein PROFUN_01960 [Planoprotostelium fungivorum]|uniref:Uncharacterized protein n=1 Tax=Planoprotostelium fungivorum TaxID=1890364 RepID=A0A2P6NAZ9_9EUKA|nr:hypothetical protein PROFUN_01960 [Planoprotostelium fungivorum]
MSGRKQKTIKNRDSGPYPRRTTIVRALPEETTTSVVQADERGDIVGGPLTLDSLLRVPPETNSLLVQIRDDAKQDPPSPRSLPFTPVTYPLPAWLLHARSRYSQRLPSISEIEKLSYRRLKKHPTNTDLRRWLLAVDFRHAAFSVSAYIPPDQFINSLNFGRCYQIRSWARTFGLGVDDRSWDDFICGICKGVDWNDTVTLDIYNHPDDIHLGVSTVLLDTSASVSYISLEMAAKYAIDQRDHQHPYQPRGTNGSLFDMVTHQALLKIGFGNHIELIIFDVMHLGEMKMVLGEDWMKIHNSNIRALANLDPNFEPVFDHEDCTHHTMANTHITGVDFFRVPRNPPCLCQAGTTDCDQ